MVVHLVPVGKQRFDLYAEPPADALTPARSDEGAIHRWIREVTIRWHGLVDEARRGTAVGRVARWRDGLVRRLADNMEDQRTLWGLLGMSQATLLYPSTVTDRDARDALNALLAEGRRHHGRWLIVEIVLVLASAILAIVPGPNLVAYYFLFRLVGHLQSWRGARHGIDTLVWTMEANDSLAELSTLVAVPRAARASRVEAIARQLKLPRLSAFFDRAAASSA